MHLENRDSDLGNPSLIIHVGTNDIETNPVELCQSQFQDVTTHSTKISDLLGHTLFPSKIKWCQLPVKTRFKCLTWTNMCPISKRAHSKNDNISDDHLFDKKHLKRKIRLLMSNLRHDLQQDERKQTQTEEAITFPVFPRHLFGQPSSRVLWASPWCQFVQRTYHLTTLSSLSFWFAKSNNCQHVPTWSWRPTFLCGSCQQVHFTNNSPNWFSTISNHWPEHCFGPVKSLWIYAQSVTYPFSNCPVFHPVQVKLFTALMSLFTHVIDHVFYLRI